MVVAYNVSIASKNFKMDPLRKDRPYFEHRRKLEFTTESDIFTMSPQSDHAYTTGGTPTLRHRRMIGSGGFGAVHEVILFKYDG